MKQLSDWGGGGGVTVNDLIEGGGGHKIPFLMNSL